MEVSAFEELIKYLIKHYNIISLEESLDLKKSQKPYVVLSFDDGYRDFIENSLPLLRKYSLPANLSVVVEAAENNITIWTQRLNNLINVHLTKNVPFEINLDTESKSYSLNYNNVQKVAVSAFHLLMNAPKQDRMNWIETQEEKYQGDVKKSSMMNWEEIKECMPHGVTIGSHTMTHDILTEITDIDTLRNELVRSKEIISDKIGQPVEFIAFPNGFYNQLTIDESLKAGYKYLLTLNESFYSGETLKVNSNLVPRITLGESNLYRNCFKVENI